MKIKQKRLQFLPWSEHLVWIVEEASYLTKHPLMHLHHPLEAGRQMTALLEADEDSYWAET